jgi:hypothetical protein
VEDPWISDSDFGSGDLENESVSAAEVHSIIIFVTTICTKYNIVGKTSKCVSSQKTFKNIETTLVTHTGGEGIPESWTNIRKRSAYKRIFRNRTM